MGSTSILIVEDDYIVAKVIEKSLVETGYRIAGMVSTGRDAVAAAEREQPDLVLMDINLQGDMDGIAAADSIRSRQNIPVVFLTAFSDQTTFSRALRTAPYGYIIKPFQTNTLATTIEVALNKRRLEEEQAVRNQWLEATLRSLSEGVITIDSGGTVTLINAVAAGMTGWAADEAQGRLLGTVLLFQDPITKRNTRIATTPVIAEGIVTTLPDEFQIVTRGGTLSPIGEVIASPVRDGTGRITGAAIVLYQKEAPPTSPGPSPAPRKKAVPESGAVKVISHPVARNEPVSVDDWIDRGNSLIFLRKYPEAAAAYDRAIAISPTNYQAWYGRGTALAKTGKLPEAIVAYDQALSIHPRNHQILMAKGVLLKKSGDDAGANHCFELAHLYTP